MKNLLLFVLAFGVSITWSFGQANIHQSYEQDAQPPIYLNQIDLPSINQLGPVNHHKSTKGAISFVTIGYSANVYTLLLHQQSCLTTNEDIGVLNFIHRGGASPGSIASGDILNSHSTDGGDTWSTNLVVPNTPTYNNRYPSGVIYNPTGNTIADSAYIVYCGPSYDLNSQSSYWDNTYLGSCHFDSSNIHNQFFPTLEALVTRGLSISDDGEAHVVGSVYSRSPYIFDTLYIMNGAYNSNTHFFDWTTFIIDSANFAVKPNGNDFAYVWYWNTAWSDDGVTGYIWTMGRDTLNDCRSYQPLVWKTTNSGTSWNMMTPFDFGTLTEITDRLQPMRGTTISRPQFSYRNDGVVDANGNLHLISYIKAASSNNDDSLSWQFYVAGIDSNNAYYNPIYDVYTTSSGWEAKHLADVYTFDVDADESGFGTSSDAIGWSLRLQAGKTKDGTKIFASWSDTDTLMAPNGHNGLPINLFPNLYVAAWDIVTGKQTIPTNFTIGGTQDGDCFFHFMSDIIIDDNGTYTIPMTETDIGVDPLATVTHNYVKGIQFTDADFVTNPGLASTINNIVTVSQNRPNPFNEYTNIDVKLTQESDVVIEVISITGQKLLVLNNGKLSAGNHTFQINRSNLSAGVYFYTVHAGEYSVTKKMIVQ